MPTGTFYVTALEIKQHNFALDLIQNFVVVHDFCEYKMDAL
jgi:hypothetical protein